VESDLAFIEDVAPMLQDSRYVRIQEKPVLILYRANLLPNASETVLRWREYTKKLGIGDIYLIAAQSFGFTDPTEVGFDAAVEFPPHGLGLLMMEHLHKQLEFVNPVFNGRVFDYRLALGSAMRQETTPYTLFRTAMTGWDNTPRTGGMRGYVGHRATPELYQAWLEYCCSYAAKNNRPHEQLVFINAWNEWAEGAHLEPDKKFGYAYLQATADALMANGDQKLAKG
jgi:lipopolysaccharide biosynthesis protein